MIFFFTENFLWFYDQAIFPKLQTKIDIHYKRPDTMEIYNTSLNSENRSHFI